MLEMIERKVIWDRADDKLPDETVDLESDVFSSDPDVNAAVPILVQSTDVYPTSILVLPLRHNDLRHDALEQ